MGVLAPMQAAKAATAARGSEALGAARLPAAGRAAGARAQVRQRIGNLQRGPDGGWSMPTGSWYHPDVNEIIEKHSRGDAGGGGGQWCAALQPLALPCFVAFLMLGVLRPLRLPGAWMGEPAACARSRGFLRPQGRLMAPSMVVRTCTQKGGSAAGAAAMSGTDT